ncbi:MAG: hypothetical protein CMB77_03955 [Euryarchaeota archaeon]|nr:hypothetical protein [Euryarchaeota archaeon]|tara:strand:+ start:28014 stop:28397 length:384 start_codon:yes stop_codon:yes gene_type:complete
MTDYTNQEFQRILGNPENEIISDSLKERLGPSSQSIDLSISFGKQRFECTLDSFSLVPDKRKLSRISLLLGAEVIGALMSGDEFVINCNKPDIYITASDCESIDCFKYNNDTYVLEVSIMQKGVLSD